MNVILIGGGKLAYFLAKQFASKGYNLTIVDENNAEATILSRNIKATVICGAGSDPKILEQAGAYQADIVVSLCACDEDNLIACQILN
ncbi:MAG: NAD-binding protein [Prochloraceae cyanobacterium]